MCSRLQTLVKNQAVAFESETWRIEVAQCTRSYNSPNMIKQKHVWLLVLVLVMEWIKHICRVSLHLELRSRKALKKQYLFLG